MSEPLDAGAVQDLALEFLKCVRAHYESRPTARSTAQEVLNASAIVVALIVGAARAAGQEESAREFFELALESQLEEPMPTTLAELTRLQG